MNRLIQIPPILNLINQCSQPLILESKNPQENGESPEERRSRRAQGIPQAIQTTLSRVSGYVFEEDSTISITEGAVTRSGQLKAVVYSPRLTLTPDAVLIFRGKRYSVIIEREVRDFCGEFVSILKLNPV